MLDSVFGSTAEVAGHVDDVPRLGNRLLAPSSGLLDDAEVTRLVLFQFRVDARGGLGVDLK